MAFAGCALIGFAGSRSGSSGAGVALLVLAAVAYASAAVVQKSALARVSPFQVTWLGCVAGTIACLPFAPALLRELRAGGASSAGWLAYLGLGPTALGFATWTFALRRTTAGRLASVAYLIPVVSIVLGAAVLSETPPPLAAAGGALCVAGVIWARTAVASDSYLCGSKRGFRLRSVLRVLSAAWAWLVRLWSRRPQPREF